jgi:type II secretory pathway pseudopilin PulG
MGFGLVEAIAATAIIGAVSVAALGSVAMQTRAALAARTAAEETAMARYKINELKTLGTADLAAIVGRVSADTFPSPFGSFRYRASVTDRNPMLELSVTVYSQRDSLRMTSLVRRIDDETP